MAKWNKKTFLLSLKDSCMPHIINIVIDLIKYADDVADVITWGRGEGYGTMTFKCKSGDFGVVPMFHVTTGGQIKFLLNHMRSKVRKKEILRDFQLKLESNFMMNFDEEEYNSDIYYQVDDLFNTKSDIDKFKSTIDGITARLKQ